MKYPRQTYNKSVSRAFTEQGGMLSARRQITPHVARERLKPTT
nr:MAG TPA: hypothetical protein [Caudoviricetes sp.]